MDFCKFHNFQTWVVLSSVRCATSVISLQRPWKSIRWESTIVISQIVPSTFRSKLSCRPEAKLGRGRGRVGPKPGNPCGRRKNESWLEFIYVSLSLHVHQDSNKNSLCKIKSKLVRHIKHEILSLLILSLPCLMAHSNGSTRIICSGIHGHRSWHPFIWTLRLTIRFNYFH